MILLKFFCFKHQHHFSQAWWTLWQALRGRGARCPYSVTFPYLTGPNTCIQVSTAQPINHCLLIQRKRKCSRSSAQTLSVFGPDLFWSFPFHWMCWHERINMPEVENWGSSLQQLFGERIGSIHRFLFWPLKYVSTHSFTLHAYPWLIMTFVDVTLKESGTSYSTVNASLGKLYGWCMFPRVHVSSSKSHPLIFQRSLSMQACPGIISTLSQPHNVCGDKLTEP